MFNFTQIFSWGLILQAMALIHFFYRRPNTFWVWIIIFFPPLGALAYMFMEVVPDLGLLRASFQGFSRRSRINQLEHTVPSIRRSATTRTRRFVSGREEIRASTRVLQQSDRLAARLSRSDLPPRHRRDFLGDFPAAVKALEFVTSQDQKYDFHRAIALLAHAYANTSQPDKADALFRQATAISTSSETYINYATFLESQKRNAEAREWAEHILAKKPTMPRYLRRRERPWFSQATALLKRVPK